MDQYAHLLAERIEGAALVEESGGIAGALAAGRVAVLAPSRWLRAADPLPHSWDATSDSVAAFVAGALDARRLVLVKPAEVGEDGVDRLLRDRGAGGPGGRRGRLGPVLARMPCAPLGMTVRRRPLTASASSPASRRSASTSSSAKRSAVTGRLKK